MKYVQSRVERRAFVIGYRMGAVLHFQQAIPPGLNAGPAQVRERVNAACGARLAVEALRFLRDFGLSVRSAHVLRRPAINNADGTTAGASYASLGLLLWSTRQDYDTTFRTAQVALGTHLTRAARGCGKLEPRWVNGEPVLRTPTYGGNVVDDQPTERTP